MRASSACPPALALLLALPVAGAQALAPGRPPTPVVVPVAVQVQVPTGLRVFPARLDLHHADDHGRFVVLAEFEDGTTQDVTSMATLLLPDATPFKIDRQLALHPLHDGTAEVEIRYGGQLARLPVSVRDSGRRAAVSFQNDVMPILTKAGCNAGSCHGNAAGKNGFRLSLFGYDAAADHLALTRDLRGRRMNPAAPEESLMLIKPLRLVAHGGGQRLTAEGDGHRTLHRWIAEGAHDDLGKAPALTGLEVLPRRVVLAAPDETQTFLVRAQYADGSQRDVTDLALISTSNESTARLESAGSIRSGAPGEAHILARFGTFAEVAQVLVIDGAKDFTWPDVPTANYIDAAIHAKLRRMRIAPAPRCDDATFLRRVHLDVIGLLPTPAETKAFLADASPDKRRQLVDRLLARPEFPDVQAMQWAEVLRIESQQLERKGMHVYTEYLREAFRDGVPLNALVRELLTAKGSNFRDPAANFYLTQRQPILLAEDVAQNFLGIRLQCAQCHNHPFERWTMDDYYGFAAFFARVGRKRGEHPYEQIVIPRPGGELRNPRTGRNAVPLLLGGKVAEIDARTDRRAVLASWLTAADNPWFRQNLANRVWARFFGRGIVDPPDDVRVSNPPSHPELYAELGRRLASYDFDVRRLIRDICASHTYQRASGTGTSPAALYAEAAVRRLGAEQLLDAISSVTGIAERYRNLPAGARASQVEDGNPRNRFLDVFGRPRRTSACTCDRQSEPTLGQALHLINGDTIGRRLSDRKGRLHALLRGDHSPAAILEELFLATYSRPPRRDETDRLLADLPSAAAERAKVFEDLFWALLNSKEFLFNH